MKSKNTTLMGRRIRDLRNDIDMKQTELASRIGTTASNISNYESGRATPPLDKIKQMALIFNVPLDYLTGESNSRNYKEDQRYIEVDHYLTELIKALDDSESTLKYSGLPISRDARAILKLNLEHTLNTLRTQLQNSYTELLNNF